LVDALLIDGDHICGVQTSTQFCYFAKTVVLTTGTFLGGRLIIGNNITEGGRAGERAAIKLSDSLTKLGFELGRLKTGTPPRIDARTIDFSQTIHQFGSDVPLYFSFEPDKKHARWLDEPLHPAYLVKQQTEWRRQMPCYLVYSTEETHEIVRNNLDRSPMFSGMIEGIGPRYCPSFEDKIVRFADKPHHQLFLEPEGWQTIEVYIQGYNTSMPEDVQWDMVQSIPALRNAEIIRAGYAVEYDYVPPHQLHAWLETKNIKGLFHAGQINGTTGYEEAAAQGLMAGINAALKVQGKSPLILKRDEAYIGVLIDDLVTQEHTEPYRQMTSRAEYRLLLRQDNADLRLTPHGYAIGLIGHERFERVQKKQSAIMAELNRLAHTTISPNDKTNTILSRFGLPSLNDGVNAKKYLRRPQVTYQVLAELIPATELLSDEVIKQVSIETKFEGYIAKQLDQVERIKRLESMPIPADFDHEAITALRLEARQKLSHFRPATLGQAGRIAGVNPADISVLLVHLKRREH